MTLEEAISLNEDSEKSLRKGKFNKHADAVKLGIEALKAWKEIRREWRRPSSMLLPGEEKE